MVETIQSVRNDAVRDAASQAEAIAIPVVFSFLKALAGSLGTIERDATPAACNSIFAALYGYLAAHIPRLRDAHNDRRVSARMHTPTAALMGPLSWLRAARWRRDRNAGGSSAAKFSAGAEILKTLADLNEAELLALVGVVVEQHRDSIARAVSFIDEVRAESDKGKTVIFLTVGFPTTWAPLAQQLSRSGVRTYAVCLYDYANSLETGVLNTVEIPVGNARVLDFLGHLIVLAAAGPASVLLNTDSYYGANWDAERGTLVYALIGAMLAGARAAGVGRAQLVALKYDAVQQVFKYDNLPMDRDPRSMLIGHFYRQHMTHLDRIVYNSNSEIMGAFNENSVPLAIPRLHFYRYTSQPARSVPRRDLAGGTSIHMVILSSFLSGTDDFCGETRGGHADIVRSAILQDIHIHYFCDVDHPVIASFIGQLPPDKRQYFHPHAVIRDQQALIDEIQQYHVGLVISDDTAFLKSISTLADVFYRDATSMLWQSTIGSSPFAFAAAGLPFICPRYMLGVQDVFGPDVAMPMTLSELRNVRGFLEKCDLPRRMAAAHANRHRAWMDTNIRRFVDFLDG